MGTKVLSCKVKENIYNTINSMEKPNSEILRELVTKYVKSLQNNNENNGIPKVYQRTRCNDYKTIVKRVDEIIDRKKHFFEKTKNLEVTN